MYRINLTPVWANGRLLCTWQEIIKFHKMLRNILQTEEILSAEDALWSAVSFSWLIRSLKYLNMQFFFLTVRPIKYTAAAAAAVPLLSL
jgi:hypothetical protein